MRAQGLTSTTTAHADGFVRQGAEQFCPHTSTDSHTRLSALKKVDEFTCGKGRQNIRFFHHLDCTSRPKCDIQFDARIRQNDNMANLLLNIIIRI